MSSSAAASRRHWRRSGSSDSGFDSASGSESERPYAPAEARPRRTRTLMTPQQLTILHALLEQTRFPTTNQREEVARQTGLMPRKVQVWFQNQRQKLNDAARRSNAANLPLYSHHDSQWSIGLAAAHQGANPTTSLTGHHLATQELINARFDMTPIRPQTPDASIPTGVANNGGSRYDSVTYGTLGAVVPPTPPTNIPVYGMAPLDSVPYTPLSAEAYRLRSLRSLRSPPKPQYSRYNLDDNLRLLDENLRLPPLNLMLDNARELSPAASSSGRAHRHTLPQPSVPSSTAIKGPLVEAPDLTGQISRDGDEPLAFGGYSTVWRGIWRGDQSIERKVVIKILRGLRASRDEDIRTKLAKRLRREMKVWANLHHPNVVPLLGHSTEPEGPALISPLYEGGHVVDYLAAHPSADRNRICADVAAGLLYLHSHDPPIIHGDIKGANVLIDENGSGALCDFGLSLTRDGGPTGYTTSDFGGSLRYLAPELLESTVRTTATDIYALGCTCMQILFSKQPHGGHALEAHIMRAIMTGCPPFQLQEEQTSKLRFDPLVLRRTWDVVPSQRPAAQDFAAIVQTGLDQDSRTIPLNQGIVEENERTIPAIMAGLQPPSHEINNELH